MRIKAVLAIAVVALLGASLAVAAPPPGKGKPPISPPTGKGKPQKTPTGKGKPPTTGPTCKPMVTVVLKGNLTSVSGSTLTMSVVHGNRWARAYVTAGTANVAFDPLAVKVRRNGKKTLTDLVPGDWLLVQARACKADLGATVSPALTAVRVVAHPTKA
jgi:hypothetical protein